MTKSSKSSKIILQPNIPDESICSSQSGTDIVDEPFAHERAEITFKEERFFYYIRITFVGFGTLCALVTIFTFMFHLIAPEQLFWLHPDNLARIQGMALSLIGGLVMSASTTYFFRKKR